MIETNNVAMQNRMLRVILTMIGAFGSLSLSVGGNEVGQSRVFNIKSYGAVGDGIAVETKAVQATIDACHRAGGGVVRVPAGDFQIGTIHLKSNVTLSFDYGARLLGSTNLADYPTEDLDDPREGGPHCLFYAKDASNITIEGLGVIDGRGTPEFFPRNRSGGRNRGIRPRLLRMVNCEKLTFSGVTYKRPAFWGLHLIDCQNIHFNAVTIRFRNNNFNNDGIDLDGCEHVLIENCDIDSGDDAICLKSSKNPCKHIVVRGCKVSSNTAPLKFGTSSRGGFIDVRVTNCYFYNSPMGAIKLQLVDGGRLENIDISRIVMKEVGNPIFIRLGDRGKTYTKGNREKAPVGTLKNVRISDVVAEVTIEDRAKAALATYKNLKPNNSPEITDRERAKAGPIMITGIPGHCVENITLENIQISFPGGGTSEDAGRIIAEDRDRYPEQFFFGPLPAWGAYIRHARDIRFINVNLSSRSEDAREKLYLEDVEGFVTSNNFQEANAQVSALSKLVTAPVTRDIQGAPAKISPGEMQEIYFDALDYEGKATRVFALIQVPESASVSKKVPGIVLVHGGGGSAFREWVDLWVARGYAAVSIAVEGQTNERENGANGRKRWKRHAWAGPQRSGIYGDLSKPIQDQWMYHAVADTVLANSLLRSVPAVDADKVGVMGISWGGVITSTVIGIDDRFAFAIPTYGCGNKFDSANQYGKALGQSEIYKQVWDPMVRLEHAKMPVQWLSWPGDKHFPMDALAASYRKASGPRLVTLIPEMKHGHGAGWRPPDSYAFADSIVREGKVWAQQTSAELERDRYQVTFKTTKTMDRAVLISTIDTGFTGHRNWIQTPAELEEANGEWTVRATLPEGSTAWFVNLTSGSLTVSSDYEER